MRKIKHPFLVTDEDTPLPETDTTPDQPVPKYLDETDMKWKTLAELQATEPMSRREELYEELSRDADLGIPVGSLMHPETIERIRTFESGATRDTNTGKYDYEAFLCPLVTQRFAEYMHQHRTQSDGTLRDGDNWQKGIPTKEYMKSLWRHMMDLWLHLRGYPMQAREPNLSTVCCAVMFNVQGILHNHLTKKDKI
jgi:hypothetical protein